MKGKLTRHPRICMSYEALNLGHPSNESRKPRSFYKTGLVHELLQLVVNPQE